MDASFCVAKEAASVLPDKRLQNSDDFRRQLRYSQDTNNTAKIQLKILGRTSRLTSGAIDKVKKLTLYWVLNHDAKKEGN